MSSNQENLLNVTIEIIDHSSQIELEYSHLMLLYCIEGTTMIDQNIYCNTDNFVILERGKTHLIECRENALIVLIFMDYYALCNYKHCDSLFFFCDSTHESGYKYKELKNLLTALTKTFVLTSGTSLQFMSEALLLQDYLLEHFTLQTKSQDAKKLSKNQRLQKILDYVYVNSTDKISLQVLSQRFYISSSVLSRTFTEMTGESFVSFVRKVRLSKISRELINTEKSITSIAIDNGFSNASAMSGAFRRQFGMQPSEYRKKYHNDSSIPEHQKQLSHRLKQKFILQPKAPDQTSTSSNIHLKFQPLIEQKKWNNTILNVGSARHMINAKVQEHILFLKKSLKIEYVRIWNIFSRNLIIQNKNLKKISFVRLDTIFDFCVENDIKLFIDLGQRAEIIMADEKNELYNKSDNILFESQQEWETFLTQFIRHLLHRYGENIISEWIFEFGFFLIQKPYYISEKYNATDTWDKGYEIIKSEIPSVQIAGPGLVSHQDQDFLRKIINNFFCAKHKPDLFTTVHFPYASSKNKGNLDALPSRTYTKISNDIHFLQEGIETIRSILSDMGFKGKHVVAEWNYSISNRNYLQDSCFRACYIMENILQNMDKCDTMALWYATDLINVSYDSVRVLSGSAGLVSVDGICKPSFYAFSFLKKIGRYKLYQKDNLLITADSKEQFYILCCNSRPLGVKYYLTDEKDYGPEDLETLFNSADSLSEQIIIDGLNDGDIYTIRNQILNNHKGSVLERWISLSCNDALSFDDISYLKQISIPEITMERLIVEHGKLTLKLNLQPDEIRAISIIKN